MENYMPTRVHSGINAIENYKNEFNIGKKCLIVTGKNSAKKSGALDDVTKVLNELNIQYSIYDGITANPLMASCIEAGKLANQINADFIVGIGGGSPLDASKIVAKVATNPDISKKDIYQFKWDNASLPFILVGTTSGTGSEVTKVAVITDEEDGRKKSTNHNDYYAKVAFGDPRYTQSLSRDVTISTAIDALAHCVESYLSNKANDISRAYAVAGIKMLIKPLRNLLDENYVPDLKVREELYNASILGGLSINVTGTTVAHTLGYYLTEGYKVPHGIACAIFMEDLFNFVEKDNKEYLYKLFEESFVTKEELIKIVKGLLPKHDIHMSLEEIESLLPRYENNNSVNNTKGHMSVPEIKELLINKFNK